MLRPHLARLAGAQARCSGGIDHRAVEAPIAEIPEAMPWEYFQAAPPDQRIEPLRGGEWLVLDGLHPTRPRVQTCLPPARGAARVATLRGGPTQSAVELVCDTLAIDGDRQTFSLSWRGRYEVADGEAALPALFVLAALEVPGVPVDWARIRAARAQRARAPEPHAGARLSLGAGTMAVSLEEVAAIAPKAALPFGPPGAPARPPSTEATPWSARAAPPSQDERTLEPQPGQIRRDGALPFPGAAVAPKRSPDEIHGAPWSRVAPPPVAPREQEPGATDVDPLDLVSVEPEVARPPPAPPPVTKPLPPVPDAWARVPEPPPVLSQPPARGVGSREITIERCAELRAEMDAGRLRDEVLGWAGVTAEEWTAAQRGWLEKMGAELGRGRFELTNRYTQAFLAQQRARTAR